jgi:hypothetical protein
MVTPASRACSMILQGCIRACQERSRLYDLVGCQKSALPVSCSDGPTSAVGHDDQPCPCACSISCLAGSAAGLSCLAARQRPRTRNCSCCGTRSPCCAAPNLRPPAGLGGPRCPRCADPAPAQKAADAPAGHARHDPAVATPPRVAICCQDVSAGTFRGDRRIAGADMVFLPLSAMSAQSDAPAVLSAPP